MKPTHKYTNAYGHVMIGVIVAHAQNNAVWFLPMCDDHKTWQKESMWVVGVRAL
jgi:hypothetical protein